MGSTGAANKHKKALIWISHSTKGFRPGEYQDEVLSLKEIAYSKGYEDWNIDIAEDMADAVMRDPEQSVLAGKEQEQFDECKYGLLCMDCVVTLGRSQRAITRSVLWWHGTGCVVADNQGIDTSVPSCIAVFKMMEIRHTYRKSRAMRGSEWTAMDDSREEKRMDPKNTSEKAFSRRVLALWECLEEDPMTPYSFLKSVTGYQDSTIRSYINRFVAGDKPRTIRIRDGDEVPPKYEKYAKYEKGAFLKALLKSKNIKDDSRNSKKEEAGKTWQDVLIESKEEIEL